MANPEHLEILKQGVHVWNQWREDNPDIFPNLREANLNGLILNKIYLRGADLHKADLHGTSLSVANLFEANLYEANLSRACLVGANLFGATMSGANLSGANLSGANLTSAYLSGANLIGADLYEAILSGANLMAANLNGADLTNATLIVANLSGVFLIEANLTRANLHGVNLDKASLVEANLTEANLTGVNLNGTYLAKAKLVSCRVHGVSVWDAQLKGAIQQDLIITQEGQPVITVDNLEVAQFIYLLIHNEKLRDVIDTVGKKAVLILGRFTPRRKAVLNAIRDELRKHNYIPILFDFEKPSSRGFKETISLLAHMARFIIADITYPNSIQTELEVIIPNLPSVPIQPIIHVGKTPYALFEYPYDWVLKVHEYPDLAQLIAEISEKVIEPAEAKVNELRPG